VPKRVCECGECGRTTGGGRFLPGHDAKLKSRLLRDYRSGDPALRKVAAERILSLGWGAIMTKERPNRLQVAHREPLPETARAFRSKAAKAAAVSLAFEESRLKRDRRRRSGLRELVDLASALCTVCSHDHDVHVEQDGRSVCLDCQDTRAAVHTFASATSRLKGFWKA